MNSTVGNAAERRPSEAECPAAKPSATMVAVGDYVQSEELKTDLLRAHGDFTLAYSARYQPGLQHFGDDRGYIAFAQAFGYTFALGDPITDLSYRDGLICRFVAAFPNACFVQVHDATAVILDRLGYRINGLGVDTVLDLQEYSFYGKTKERYRYAQNWLNGRGYECFESTIADVGRDHVERLSLGWRKTRTVGNREVCFLNRPIVFRPEPDTRQFFLSDKDGRPLVYIGLDPIYRDGEVIGYSTAFKRRDPEAPSQAEQGLMKVLVEQLKEEGYEQLRLGLSPLAYVKPHSYRTNTILNWSWGYGFKAKWVNRRFYNLQGHADYKRRFIGREVQTYFAARGLIQDFRLFALLRLCKII